MFPASRGDYSGGAPPRRLGPRDFTRRMSAAERRAWERHYLPWSHEMAVAVAAGLPGTRWLQLVIDIVIDNHPLRSIEERYRLRHGTAIDYLREGLERYGRHCSGRVGATGAGHASLPKN